MAKKHEKPLNRVKCEICSYYNDKDLIAYSGVCHGCGNILDQKAYFKTMMNKKLRLWRDERPDAWLRGNNSIYYQKVKGTKDKGRV